MFLTSHRPEPWRWEHAGCRAQDSGGSLAPPRTPGDSVGGSCIFSRCRMGGWAGSLSDTSQRRTLKRSGGSDGSVTLHIWRSRGTRELLSHLQLTLRRRGRASTARQPRARAGQGEEVSATR